MGKEEIQNIQDYGVLMKDIKAGAGGKINHDVQIHEQNSASYTNLSLDSTKQGSVSSSSSSSDYMEDTSSSSSSLINSNEGGPLYELSELMAKLPLKRRGLSKYYDGKSQSFTSLANVNSVQDLVKVNNNPCNNKRMKLMYAV